MKGDPKKEQVERKKKLRKNEKDIILLCVALRIIEDIL